VCVAVCQRGRLSGLQQHSRQGQPRSLLSLPSAECREWRHIRSHGEAAQMWEEAITRCKGASRPMGNRRGCGGLPGLARGASQERERPAQRGTRDCGVASPTRRPQGRRGDAHPQHRSSSRGDAAPRAAIKTESRGSCPAGEGRADGRKLSKTYKVESSARQPLSWRDFLSYKV